VLLCSEPCYVLWAAENTGVFERDLKEATGEWGSRPKVRFKKIPHCGPAVEKARNAKYETNAGFENARADDRNCPARTVDSLTVVR